MRNDSARRRGAGRHRRSGAARRLEQCTGKHRLRSAGRGAPSRTIPRSATAVGRRHRGGSWAPDVRNRGSHAAPAGRQDGGDPSNRGRAVTRNQRGMLLGHGRGAAGEAAAALRPLGVPGASPAGRVRRRHAAVAPTAACRSRRACARRPGSGAGGCAGPTSRTSRIAR